MYKDFKRSGGGRGGRDFGDRKPWDRGGQGGGFKRAEMHKATCADCGNVCAVPFRPNGRKPVYCSDCFQKEGNAEPRRFDGGENRRFSRDDRPQRDSFHQSFAPRDSRMDERMDRIEMKLDSIIKSLGNLASAELTKEEHAIDGEDILEAVVTKPKKVTKKKKKA